MLSHNFSAIGLMSGTSLDGLDICYTKFEQYTEHLCYQIIKAQTIRYTKEWENRLKNAIHLSPEELLQLNVEYGFLLGQLVKDFIDNNTIENIDVIASHGHTVFHQPSKKFTLQIGDGRAIKLLTNIPVVYDFRTADVLMGGNGAPLVPIGDEMLFGSFSACINLGGFSNISFKNNGNRVAFDIAPVNIVLNFFAQKLGMEYDKDGLFAQNGKVDVSVLNKLNNLPYYHSKFPKSLGVEWVNENVLPLLEGMEYIDALATFTEHAAVQIASVIDQQQLEIILVTGGGTFNTYLIEKIQQKIKGKLFLPSQEIIEYKEALIFALMGVLRINNLDNVLSSATGSSKNHCAGLLV